MGMPKMAAANFSLFTIQHLLNSLNVIFMKSKKCCFLLYTPKDIFYKKI
jgi:hypothetical protein